MLGTPTSPSNTLNLEEQNAVCQFFLNNQLDVNLFFFCMFISIHYMFRAAMCPSSGELIVSIRHLVHVTLYRWPLGVQVWMRLQSHPELILSIRHLVYVTLYRWPLGVQVWMRCSHIQTYAILTYDSTYPCSRDFLQPLTILPTLFHDITYTSSRCFYSISRYNLH
jgi:hypothetical protein